MSSLLKYKNNTKIEICKQEKDVQKSKDDQVKAGTAVIIPPDGGWGWVVVVAAFVCTFIVDGVLYSGGMLLKSIQQEFNATDKDVASVYSLLCGFYLIASPFASALTNNYSFTKVTIMGSLFASVGFGLSYFATSVGYLHVTIGLLGALGFSLINITTTVAVGFYFEKFRGLATGLAFCGSGVGTFVLAPLSDKMVELYGWRITMVIYGGLCCLGIICGLVYRPIEPIVLEIDDECNNLKDVQNEVTIPLEKKTCETSQFSSDVNSNQTHKEMKLYRENLQRKRRCSEGLILGNKVYFESKNRRLSSIKDEENDSPLLTTSLRNIMQATEGKGRIRRRSDVALPAFNRDDMLYSGSLTRLPEYASMSSLQYHLSVTHCEDEDQTGKKNSILKFLKKFMCSLFDVSLFQSATFILLTLSGFLFVSGGYTTYMFVAKRAEEHGMDKTSSALLVSSIGIANIVGRLACGLFTTAPRMSSLMLSNIVLTLGGIATMVSGFCYHSAFQFGYCVIFGLTVACFVSLRPILAVEYLGLNKLTNCFGLFLLFQGFGALIGTPIAGALRDVTGDYDVAFYVAGGSILLSSVVCYPIPYIYKWEKARKETATS